ncbi:MAG: HNH endonuclease [Timaviella obliquedivisa GSE-PSE-MK23-08B]|jgi:prepilin-type processing-associated H-X9-DG protein|nr:HNH endonuclease [Timaviella obliquedivisa GSE-PSE-MK23-08B]
MYGYVQPSGKGDYFERTINIDNLDAPKHDVVNDVLSVWLASHPDKSGTRVIGWYKSSTVYRKHQPSPNGSNRTFKDSTSSFGYCVTAKAENCVCLPIEERTIRVPRMVKGGGGLGRSNVWFADGQKEITLNCRKEVEELVLQYQTSEITQLSNIRQEMEQGDFFNTETLKDARERVLISIVRRQGQSQFRQQLLRVYKGKCAILGNDVEQALEAAHIIPYCGLETNTTSNGLLLRADLHTLFDLNLITIDPQTMKVLIAPKLT